MVRTRVIYLTKRNLHRDRESGADTFTEQSRGREINSRVVGRRCMSECMTKPEK